ncbi:MAG: PAS domain S-box protein [Promethearchaeota archaeon]
MKKIIVRLKKKIIRNKILGIGIIFYFSYCIIEAMMYVYIFKISDNFFQELFTEDIHELYMRIVIIWLILFLSVISQYLIIKEKNMAKKLRESEKLYSTTLKSIGDAVIATDRFGNINFVNPIAEGLTGFNPGESIGKPLKDIFNIINEETRKKVENPVSKVIREGIVVGLANHTILIAKDGKEIPIADSGAPIKDDKGNIIGIVLIFRDITERRKAEQKLKVSEKKFRELFNNMSSGVAIYEAINDGEDFIFKDFNLAGERIDNIKKEDLIGKRVLRVFPGVKEFGLIDVFQRVWTTGKLENHPISQYKDNRIEGWRENYVYKLPTGEIVAIYDDITAQKVAEQKLKESEKEYREAYNRAEFYKDLFTHDINNILQIMLSGIQLSEMHVGDPEKIEKLKKYNSIIKDQIKRGAKLVSNIRKLSKLKEAEISIKKVEIYSILEKSITHAKNAYQDRNMKIQVDSISKKLYAKANELLEDLFDNILINAIKYNENSIVEISVKISKEKKESVNYLKIEFKDNGMGIDDSRKKLIFQRGYMEGKSGHGMGLGLSLVKGIIQTYNGKIWIEDRVKGDYSKGSNFILLIPEVR